MGKNILECFGFFFESVTISGIIKEAGVPLSFSFNSFHTNVLFSKPEIYGTTTQKGFICRELCCCLDGTPSQTHSNHLSVLLCTDLLLYSVGKCLSHRKQSCWALSEQNYTEVNSQQELDLQWLPVISFEAPTAAENSLPASCCASQHFPGGKATLLVLCPDSWALLQQ